MDISFSTNPQTLISSVSLSSQFHFIRREFLGWGSHLRPPGLLRFPRTKRKLSGLRPRAPKCLLFHNSVDDSSILVVAAAVATFAAIQLLYLQNYHRRRRHASSKFSDEQEFDKKVSSELSKQDMDLLKQEAVRDQPFSSESLYSDPLGTDNASETLNENIDFENVFDLDIKDAKHLEFQTAVLAWNENLNNHVLPDNELLAYAPTENELLKTSGIEGLYSASVMVKEVKAVERDYLSPKMPDLLPQPEEAVAVSSASVVVVEPTISCSAIPVNKNHNEISHNKYELGRISSGHGEILVSSYNGHFREISTEVSDCNEEQPVVRSISHLKSSSIEHRHRTFQDNIVYRNHLETALKGANVLVKGSHIADNVKNVSNYLEGKELTGYFKEGPMSKENESIQVHGITRDIGRSLTHKKNNGDFSCFPQQNGFARDVNGPTSYLTTYNLLLRDARLRDCIDLLEKMERMGLLDMDKVHHKNFLKACKSKKAAKEAFQFCKLIQKPTLSTFNMLLSVCASSQDFEGAFQVMLLVKEAGLKPDCKLYTTLISTCAKSGKVDAMFEVFHEMVNARVEPNVHTYGALIDGCAKAGQVAKAFGAYGIMRSKKVQPDRVIFNALITACGQSGAVDRAFDVLAEMRQEPKPIDPDHVTVGALIKTCTQAGQVDRVREVYKMLHMYNIKGTPDVYTIAVNSCSQTGDLGVALNIYDDMKKNGVVPDEMFLSTLIDVSGHAGKVDTAFEILHDARNRGIRLGNVSYSSLMGACCNAKSWQKALELYEEIKAIKLLPTVSTLNALITSLCDGDKLLKSVEVLDEMKEAGVHPNIITYSILIVACEKKDDAELGFTLLSKAKKDGILPNLIMCRCLTGLCLKSLEKAYSLGEPIVTFYSGKPQIDSKWTSLAIMVYRETISAGVIPTIEVFSQVLGCLQFPRDSSLRDRFVENLGISFDASKCSNICSLLDGFGEYDTRSFSVLEESASLGVIQRASCKENPIIVDARKLLIHTVEVYLLTILKGLKHRLAAGARLPNITILLPIEKTKFVFANGERTINVAGRVGQAVASLLRRLGLPYSGDESYGKIRINGLALRRWFKPKLNRSSFAGKPGEMIPTPTRLAKGISDQQRNIRSINNLSLE